MGTELTLALRTRRWCVEGLPGAQPSVAMADSRTELEQEVTSTLLLAQARRKTLVDEFLPVGPN